MSNNTLPVSNLVSVEVNFETSSATVQNTNTLMILGSTNVIDTKERIRSYSSIADVKAELGSASPEYAAAILYYEQSPQPINLVVGRWAKTATPAMLRCATLTAAQQEITLWNAVTSGGFKISVDGVENTISGMNFSTAANMNAVASIIQTALAASVAGMTCEWDSIYSRLNIVGATTGNTASLSLLTAPATGTDISAMMGGTSAFSAAYVVDGHAAETPADAVADIDDAFGQQWYGVTVIGASSTELLAVSAYIEAAGTKHVHGISTQDTGCLSATSTTDIAYLVKNAAYRRTFVQYSSSTPYSAASMFGRMLTVDYTGNNTVITLMYKKEPGITAEYLTTSQAAAAKAKYCNVFVYYNNNTAIIQYGQTGSGNYIDEVTGTDWLALDIQSELFNALYGTTTKIPQTDAGNNILKSRIESVLDQGVTNGLLAAGQWNSTGFGSLSQGDYLTKGYYIYQPSVDDQTTAQRTARSSVKFQVAAKFSGAIHNADVAIYVNN